MKRVDTATNLTEASLSMQDFFDRCKRVSSQNSIGPTHEEPLTHLIANHLVREEGYSPAYSAAPRNSDSSLASEASPALSKPKGLSGLGSIETHILLTLEDPAFDLKTSLEQKQDRPIDEVIFSSTLCSQNVCKAGSSSTKSNFANKHSIFYRLYGDGSEKVLMIMGLAASHRCARRATNIHPQPNLRLTILLRSD